MGSKLEYRLVIIGVIYMCVECQMSIQVILFRFLALSTVIYVSFNALSIKLKLSIDILIQLIFIIFLIEL